MHKKILLAILLGFFALPWLCSPAVADEAVVGQPAPALIVGQFDGYVFDLAKRRGHVVIVSFWATWCAPCREEMPVLDAVYRRDHASGLEVIGVSADSVRHHDEAARIMEKYSYPGAMLSDAEINDFGKPAALPVTYVVGANGIVQAKLTLDEAPVTEESLEKLLQPLLTK